MENTDTPQVISARSRKMYFTGLAIFISTALGLTLWAFITLAI